MIKLKDILEGRTPRKKGQPAKSKKHSDLYTDEDPKGTIKGLGFKDAATARKGVGIINKADRKHAHKVQATLVMKQRAKVAKERTKDPEKKKKLSAAYKIWSDKLEQLKKKTKSMKEADLHSKLSRGHKPDYYQLGTSEFKPFDKSRDDIEEVDTNIFSADDEQDWPSGPFGKKDYYPDEAGSSYKRDKDWQPDKPGEDEDTKGTGYTAENFADGKKQGRKGISKRVGIPKGATLTQLAKLAKAKGEKGRMARWQLNMRRGKKKKK